MPNVFFKRRPPAIEISSAFLIVLGTFLAGNLLNAKDLNFSVFGMCLALGSALLYTLYVLFMTKLGNEVPMFEKSALMTTGSAIMILLINVKSIANSSHLDSGPIQWGTFLAVFGTVISPICFTVGMPKIGAGLSSILLTLELPAAVFCAHLILHEEITFVQLTGISIMIGAIIYLNLSKYGQKKRSEATKPII